MSFTVYPFVGLISSVLSINIVFRESFCFPVYWTCNANPRFFTSDIAGDLRNLAGQCPHGGVLQHFTGVFHRGNVYIKQVAGPNTPAEPWGLS